MVPRRWTAASAFNEWLIQQGYLRLSSVPTRPTPIDKAPIDWSKTQAWGDGGYYGRLFINVRGREPQGIVAPGITSMCARSFIDKIAAITDPHGTPLGSRAYRPEELYRTVNGVPPTSSSTSAICTGARWGAWG